MSLEDVGPKSRLQGGPLPRACASFLWGPILGLLPAVPLPSAVPRRTARAPENRPCLGTSACRVPGAGSQTQAFISEVTDLSHSFLKAQLGALYTRNCGVLVKNAGSRTPSCPEVALGMDWHRGLQMCAT